MALAPCAASRNPPRRTLNGSMVGLVAATRNSPNTTHSNATHKSRTTKEPCAPLLARRYGCQRPRGVARVPSRSFVLCSRQGERCVYVCQPRRVAENPAPQAHQREGATMNTSVRARARGGRMEHGQSSHGGAVGAGGRVVDPGWRARRRWRSTPSKRRRWICTRSWGGSWAASSATRTGTPATRRRSGWGAFLTAVREGEQ